MEMKLEELHAVTQARPGLRNGEHPSHQHSQGAADHYGNVSATAENLQKVESAIRTLEIYSAEKNPTRFQFKLHSDSGRIQVALVNYMTGEVVEEIPSKKLLEFSSTLEELTGLVMEKKA